MAARSADFHLHADDTLLRNADESNIAADAGNRSAGNLTAFIVSAPVQKSA